MTILLSNKYLFKQKSRKIHNLFNLSESPSSISYNDVAILFEDEDFQQAKIISLKVLRHLQSVKTLTLSQAQQILALSISGKTYQKLNEEFNRFPDARSFLKVPICIGRANGLHPRSTTIHPFPSELEQYDVLLPWRKVWNTMNTSTYEQPFLTPPLPAFCFQSTNIKISKFQSWPLDSSHVFYKQQKALPYAEAGAIISSNNSVIGLMRWYWWGEADRLNGSDFSVCLMHGTSVLNISFDLYPYAALPTLGPNISRFSRESKEFHLRVNHLRSLRFNHNSWRCY